MDIKVIEQFIQVKASTPQKFIVFIMQSTTFYGANRLVSEVYCKIYQNIYGIDTTVFRITNSFGPGEQFIPGKNAINFLIYNTFNRRHTQKKLMWVIS